jgi:hypothetical protein
MRFAAILVPIAVAAIAACTSGERGSPAADDSFTLPPAGKSDAAKPPAAQTFRGVLSFDDIEGGCTLLETPDGRRYEVVFPEGWAVDRAAGRLRGPGGEDIPAGTNLEVTGSIATDRSSICQIGPIIMATRVVVSAP